MAIMIILNTATLCQKLIIAFKENRQFSAENCVKIAENCGHNNDLYCHAF
jgi:hypothetical protein